MSKHKTPINTKRIERLRILKALENLNDKEFGDICHQTKDWTYKRLKGAVGISDYDANLIIEHFPRYRVEWLLDEGELPDIMTKDEYIKYKQNEFMHNLQNISDKQTLKKEAVKCLLHVHGYEYRSAYTPSPEEIKILKTRDPLKGSESELAKKYTSIINKAYQDDVLFIKDEEYFFQIKRQSFEELIEKVYDYIEFELSHIKEAGKIDPTIK